MKFLCCKLCSGEVEIVGNERAIVKKTKCLKCGHAGETEQKSPEVVVIIRKRPLVQ